MELNNKSKYFFLITIIVVLSLLTLFVKEVLTYLLISLVLSLLGNPIVNKLSSIRFRRFYIPKGVSALITLFLFYLVIVGFALLMAPLFIREIEVISALNPETVWMTFKQPLFDLMTALGIDVSVEQVQFFLKDKMFSLLDVAGVTSILNSLVGFVGNIFVALFSISFITFFMLKDESMIKEGVTVLTPPQYRIQVNEVLHKSKLLMRKYFGGLILEMFLNALLIGLGLGLLGIPNFYIIAFLSGLLIVVPYVGPLIAFVLGIILGVTELMESDFYLVLLPLMIKVSLVFIVTNVIDGMLFQPIIFSNTLKAHPLEIFLVLLVAGTLGGIGAMIIAIPAYSVIRIVAQEFLGNFELVKKLTGQE